MDRHAIRTHILAAVVSILAVVGSGADEPAALAMDDANVMETIKQSKPEATPPVRCDVGTECPKPEEKPNPYKGLFFDNAFGYLDDPCACRTEYYELFKRMEVANNLRIDLGGEYRHQFKNEERRSLFTGTPTAPRTDSFGLHRLRVYSNVTYGDWLRGYVEMIDAHSVHEDLPPLAIDENRADMLNAFGEARFLHTGRVDAWARVGRQELLYDAQRLVSPLDWANTRRTFTGGKMFARGKKWDVDVFWTRPVIVNPIVFDTGDQSQWFGGVHATYKCFKHQTLSPYLYLLREEETIAGPAAGAGHRVGSTNADNMIYTLGNRLNGGLDNWLWDLEGAFQFGTYGNNDVFAGMVAAGVGRKMPCLPWQPTFWAWYDFASGDEDPTDNTVNTFNQLFPLAHKYFGFVDLVARQNVHDLNFQLFLKPNKKTTVLAWMHMFWLAEAQDALYNAAGVASRHDAAGNSGREIGQEIDLLTTYDLRTGVQLQLGYSYFWSGDFVRNTGDGANQHLLYTQLALKF